MSQREAVLVIGDILTHEFSLPSGRIMLTNQNYTIPEVNGLYIALSYLGGRPIGNNNYALPVLGGLTETQEVVMLYDIQIDMMSFDASARTQKEQVYQALRSIYAQQQMEIWNMQVARMPKAFVDASSLEETKMLNRYTVDIGVTALLSLTKAADYYNTFPTPEVFPNV